MLFSRAVIPLLLSQAQSNPEYPPTLIFTGATAAMKGSAQLASFASGKFAMRAVAQSLARELGPQGIHVVHAIIDGVIDIEKSKAYLADQPDAKISPEAVCPAVHAILLLYLTISRLLIRTGSCTPSQDHASTTTSLISGQPSRNGSTAEKTSAVAVEDLVSSYSINYSALRSRSRHSGKATRSRQHLVLSFLSLFTGIYLLFISSQIRMEICHM